MRLTLTSKGRTRAIAIAAVLLAGVTPARSQPVGTAFTYQGRLTDAGNPATGPFDLRLALFDAASGGGQVGQTLTRDDVVVTNGLFTVTVDFGAVFAGSKRWLEISVRAGASTGVYTPLAPRQELTPAPNALMSASVPWAGVNGKPAGFADDTDDDVLGGLTCANGQLAKWNAGAWACAADADSGGDITSVAAGTGLTGGGTSGAVTLSAALAGSGAASTISRSDHDHLGQVWNGSGNGLRVESTGALALTGASLATTGFARGVFGESSSSQGVGVYGSNPIPDGRGTTGFAGATTGSGIGVVAVTNGPTGIGLSAAAQNPAGEGHGVLGAAFSTEGTGVRGSALATSGFANGIWGRTNSAGGFGGVFENAGGGPAVRVSSGGIRFGDGTTQTTAAIGVGDITGVLTPAGSGLTGGATSGDATLGVSFGGSGTAPSASRTDHHHLLQSWSGTNSGSAAFRVTNTGSGGFTDGLWAQSNAAGGGRGLVGYAAAATGANYGVWGQSDSIQAFGVFGINVAFGTGVEGQGQVGVHGIATTAGLFGQTTFDAPAGAVGVLGDATSLNTPAYAFYGIGNSPASYAGYFAGRVNVTGTLSKGGGSFKIDHPLDPENKYLYHSFVESPDMKNIYDGNVTTDAEGLATVELPEWFEALNRDFRYQLTVIGQFAQAIVATRIADNRFTIRTDKPAVDVSWQVTGIRKDAFAEKNRIPVEEMKPADERGTFLYPDSWGQPPEAGLDYKRQLKLLSDAGRPRPSGDRVP